MITQFQIVFFSGWLPTKKGEPIPFNPPTEQLQVKTRWTTSLEPDQDFNKTISMKYWDKEGNLAGGALIEMSSRPRFKVLECTEWIDLEVLPLELVKVWVIQRVGRVLLVECNEEEMVKIILSDKLCSSVNGEWRKVWERTTVTISFDINDDTASDYYKIVQTKGGKDTLNPSTLSNVYRTYIYDLQNTFNI